MTDTKEKSLFVPGRVCLFGEHSDWAADHGLYPGHCLVVGTDQGLTAKAGPYGDFEVNQKYRVEPVFVASPIYMFLVDLAGLKNTIKILDDLQGAYSATDDGVALFRALGPDNEQIVRDAFQALAAGDAAALGSLMIEAQINFDHGVRPYSPTELASPLLHHVLSLRTIGSLVYGGKGVGSQGDGMAQFVAIDDASRNEAMEIIQRTFVGMQCFPLTIGPRPE